MKNVLLLIHDDDGQEARLEVALDVVRAIGGHLTCLDVAVYTVLAGDDYGAGSATLYADECAREAKNKAKKEFAEVLERTGLTLDDCRAYVAAHPEMKRPLYDVPHSKGVVGMAANFVMHIAERMKTEGVATHHEELAAV